MNKMMLHCGSEGVTKEELGMVEIPRTRSHQPIPYEDSVDFVIESIRRQLGIEPVKEEYGLQRGGRQMFARLVYDVGDEKAGLAVGLRNSYDKSLRCMFGGGSQVFVCDNLSFRADGFVVMRKNTTFGWRDYRGLVESHVGALMGVYKKERRDAELMASVPCGKRRGFAFLGVALGEGILTPTQANVAFRDWREPRHEEFGAENMWSLYSCVTEGLKKGAIGGVIDRHTKAHAFFMEMAAATASKPKPKVIEATCTPVVANS